MDIAEILEGIPLGIHIIDDSGMTIFYNSACRQIDNIHEEVDVLGQPVRDLVAQGVLSKSIGLDVLESGIAKDEVQVVNGKQVYSQGTPVFREDQKIDLVIVTCMDIPYLKSMESKLTQLKTYSASLLAQLNGVKNQNAFLSPSPEMAQVRKLACKAALFDANVLITGESGVGKGVIFNYIHQFSCRYDKPKVALNCAAIPESLFESELFGYEAGSFTGANKKGKVGLLDLANTGTLFLDEIGDLSLANQAKLLSVLQEKKYLAVGGLMPKTTDVRIIAATNKDLKQMVDEKKFREDLYYRINVFPIHIRPLRERREDIIALSKYFLDQKNEKFSTTKTLSAEVYRLFFSMDWPGNVRELENFIERLILTSEQNEITLEDVAIFHPLEPNVGKKTDQLTFKDQVARFEQDLLKDLMARCGSIREMSKKSGMNESTLRKKLVRYGLDAKLKV